MKSKNQILLAGLATLLCLMSVPAYAQDPHSDVLFEYIDNKIVHYTEVSGTNNVAGSVFPVGGFFNRFASSPGYVSEDIVGLNINPGDIIYYNIHSDLLYWDGSAFTAPVSGTQITIDNNGISPNTVITTSSGEQLGDAGTVTNFIGTADGAGNFHVHVRSYFLDDGSGGDPDFGIYGYLMSLGTDEAGVADSDPYYLVFNYGMLETEYENALIEFENLLTPSVLTGDFNDDGQVDAADYTVWRDNLGGGDESAINDAGDGLNGVDSADYALWVTNFGISASSAASASAIPEPSSLLLVTASLLSICGARRN